MPWEVKDVMEQRIEFVVRVLRKERKMGELCKEYGISRTTGYRWLNRFRETGTFLSLCDRSRRPHSSPRRTPEEQEDRVVELRRQYGWGARKLEVLLKKEGIKRSERTINRILSRRGEIRKEDRRRPALRRFERSRPNELWQMDFKGEYKLESGVCCYRLGIIDDQSRYCVGLWGLSRPTYKAVRARLWEAFAECGVPEGMLFDHGTPWWGTATVLGLTRLAVDLIEQGVCLHWSGISHPQTQGKVERFFGTLGTALRHRGGPPQAFEQWAEVLGEIRQEYNHVRPHEALDMQVPADRYRASPLALQAEPAAWGYPPGWQLTQIYPSGQLRWDGSLYFVSTALRGRQVGVLEVDERLLVRYRQMYLCEVDLKNQRVHSWIRSPHQNTSQLETE